MRIYVFFFVLLSVSVFAQIRDSQLAITDKTYFDYGQVFYHGLCDKDMEWVASMLCDSVIAGEAFSHGTYCTKEKVIKWLCEKVCLLPESEMVLIAVRPGDIGEKEILFFSQKKLLFCISICTERRIITRLGVGKYLL